MVREDPSSTSRHLENYLTFGHHSGFTPARARLYRSHQSQAEAKVDLNFSP
jgi:hypothetical protein